ncbi:MAG TPA: efflux RND transporter periplasmic adaptor subunit [Candidatus Binataceae bacterium]
MTRPRVTIWRWLALAALSALLGSGPVGCGGSPPGAASDQNELQLPKLVHQGSGPVLMQMQPANLAGTTFATVSLVALPGILETSGQITFDDRKVASIISRVTGRIEEVRVSQWDYVHRGQAIATLYSPDIMTAEAEYLQAKVTSTTMSQAGPNSDEFVLSMLDAARHKLELLGIEPEQIAAIKTAAPNFVMHAPISGNVVQNQALRGSAVNPGDVLYSLGTLEDVWITADIYEDDLARVRVGQELEAVTTAYPDEVFHGTIARISPNVDPNSHVVEIRCEVKNPNFKLKPQMLARVKIVVRPGAALVVPLDALIFESENYFVYVDTGNHLLDRRTVHIATWNRQGYARVISGLNPGDRVVVQGALQVNALWHQAHGESS